MAGNTKILKTAFACWDNRIAPVFDTAQEIHIVESDSRVMLRITWESLPAEMPVQKTLRLAELGVDVLVCGAISKPLLGLIQAYGIEVVPFVAGELDEVIQAWLAGKLHQPVFSMPGCCGRGRRRRTLNDKNMEERIMIGKGQGGGGKGGGQGKGRGGQGQSGQGQGMRGQGRGRMGGPMAGGAAGYCVCPACGHKEEHQRGVPCVERKCPKCGAILARQ